MSKLPSPSIDPLAPQVLHFSCGTCGSGLSVPAALAGVTGPCPICGSTITAPRWEAPPPPLMPSALSAPPDERVPELPPAVRPPAAVVIPERRPYGHAEPQPLSTVGKSASLAGRAPPVTEEAAAAAPNRPYGASSKRPPTAVLPRARQSTVPEKRVPLSDEEKGPESTSRRSSVDGSAHGRRGLSASAQGWLAGIAGGMVICALGAAGLWMAEFRRKKPVAAASGTRATPELDRSLGAMAEMQRQREADQAQLLTAQQAALRFLQSRTAAEALPWIAAPPTDEAGWQGIPFPANQLSAHPEQRLLLLKWRRAAAEDEPMSLWRWGSEDSGIVLWLSAAASGPAVRWDGWRQHQLGLLAAFAGTPGAPPASYFVRVAFKPSAPGDVAGAPVRLLVSSPFGGPDKCEFEAMADPADPRVAEWTTALNQKKPREFLASLSWKDSPQGGVPQAVIRRATLTTPAGPPPLAQAPAAAE